MNRRTEEEKKEDELRPEVTVLLRDPAAEVPEGEKAKEFVWDENAIVPMVLKCLENRMPFDDKFGVRNMMMFLENLLKSKFKTEIAEKLVVGTEQFKLSSSSKVTMSKFTGKLLDLIKNSARYKKYHDIPALLRTMDLASTTTEEAHPDAEALG